MYLRLGICVAVAAKLPKEKFPTFHMLPHCHNTLRAFLYFYDLCFRDLSYLNVVCYFEFLYEDQSSQLIK
ncbi:hypothetical protein ZEAMMB73_Zm00001d034772 [Zea mays]|uniref:Uncharacterized protein n=1 Tax=Zea mays TaxID=4577 RepID=A0A1D6LAY6_MAIZE|nr:hypothetical protein ZEAMMB73_Zm00001d034772 [Zea mays]ONM11276.1 hypothetical protein ZEAMMB73_Zm00001d034772 [Zea mays]ONM11277.1 hypothetical protein ZEAMMB73_Zm00001d034772 [Zea mays]ONM11301.1 hypothetical protein ZEAMMB73_Zm00001d034772 [Zea mays]ONM11324.1 hypothetical protein ZEAMMB73_Zm00001d034772 [Zea mays]